MRFTIIVDDLAADELAAIRVFDSRRIVDAIRSNLADQASIETRNQKRLDATVPSFEHVAPIWELRVGDYRVFYDVDELADIVRVRAVRKKLPGQTTEDIVHD